SRSSARWGIGAASILARIVRFRGASIVAGALLGSALTLLAASPGPPARPRILGIDHAAFRVSDAAKARAFYEGLLGLRVEPAREGFRAIVGERQAVI